MPRIKPIRDQIYDRIEEYKKMFTEETGIKCEMYPCIDIGKKTLEEIGKIIKEETGHDVYKNKSRNHQLNEAKVMFSVIAEDMNYSNKDIAEYLGGDRSLPSHYRGKHQMLMIQEPRYKRRYNQIVGIFHKIEREGKYIKNE